MNKKQGLVLVIALQVVILVAMFVKAFYPLYIGTEILLKVEARDPRDIFVGNYAVLNYSFNSLDLDSIKTDLDTLDLPKLNFGDKLYVELTKKGNYYEPIGLWKEKPSGENTKNTSQNMFMRVIVQSKPYEKTISVKGGIESYFTSKENAIALENKTRWANRDSIVVEVAVKVAPDGAARIAQVNTITN